MCGFETYELGRAYGYAGAAIDLWQWGHKRQAVVLILNSRDTLESFRKMRMRPQALRIIKQIFDHAEKLEARALAKLSQPDSLTNRETRETIQDVSHGKQF